MLLRDINSKIFTVLIYFILFFPAKYLNEYYVLIILILFVLSFINRGNLNSSETLRIFIFIFIGVVISASLPVFFLGSDAFRNVPEVLRFIPVILILLNFKNINLSENDIFKIFSFYILVNFIVSYMQFSNYSVVSVVSNIYSSDLHIEYSLNGASRALGLSPGPGPNGSISAILSIFFLINYFCNEKYKKSSIFFYFISLSCILLSQSQTAFVASILSTICIIVFFVLGKLSVSIFKKLSFFIILLISVGSFILLNYMDKLKYLFTLFEYGTSRSSYVAREEKTSHVIGLIRENNFFLFFGHGKDYIEGSSSMDNEYVFLIAVYGLIVSILIFFLYVHSIVFSWINRSIFSYLVIFTILCGLIIAWPSSFITDSKLMLIFIIYLSLCINRAKMKSFI